VKEKEAPAADQTNDKRCDTLVRKIPYTFITMLQQLKINYARGSNANSQNAIKREAILGQPPQTNAIKLLKLETTFHEMIKLTYKDPKRNDSVDMKIKKMNELNFNIKLLYLIRETI
jgi:hypothetical protein